MKSRRESKKRLLRWMLVAVALAWGGMAMAQMGNLAKIDPELQELMHQSRDANERFRVIVEMTEQYSNPNLERSTAMMTRAQRRDYVVNELKHFSERSQTEVVNYLTEQSMRGGVTVQHRFWIFNGVCCEATAECIGVLSTRYDVRFVTLDKELELDMPVQSEGTRDGPIQGIQWHVTKVRATEVWSYNGASGYTGAGVVVAIIDGGVNYHHNAISGNMWDGGEAYPNHGWDFGDDDNDPIDMRGHGSHVAGIVAGHEVIYKSGIAPNATIMAVKVNTGDTPNSSTDKIICGFEFALEHGADVINCSKGAAGIGGVDIIRTKMVNILAAGVAVIVSAGNEGRPEALAEYPVPFNIGNYAACPPPWHNPHQVLQGGRSAAICVGSTTIDDIRSEFSSIGPVTWTQGDYVGNYYQDYPYDGINNLGLIRPDVVAPGTNIWSISHNSSSEYCMMNGTSMAAPCVTGVVALMLEANPNLTPAQIDMILETTAEPCEGDTMKNNNYGAGRVDAYRAVVAALDPNLSTPKRYQINVVKSPFDDRFEVTGTGRYMAGHQCIMIATPEDRFDRWEKDGEVVSTDASYTIEVTEDAEFIGYFKDCIVTTSVISSEGGTITGDGYFVNGAQCTLTAQPNLGYAFWGWYRSLFGGQSLIGAQFVSSNPIYSFTVTDDRHYIAVFEPMNYTVSTTCSPTSGGTVTGNQGSYPAGSTVTLAATANTGYAFCGWMENGVLVSNNPTYIFQIMENRNLAVVFRDAQFAIGSLVTNPDGSQGVVFHLNQTGTEGWMVALDDASEGCAWGEATNVLALQELSFSDFNALSDLSGFRNTGILRTLQGENSGYAADQVDYGNGWYLPSSGQLRKLYAALPFIEEAITTAGGATLTEDAYWSSSEYSATDAHVPSFAMNNTNKTSTCRVRAIHNFVTAGSNMVVAVSSNSSMGTASVSGNGSFTYGAPVTVTAMPNAGYAFDYWSEDGVAVSYDATYQFTFNYSRYLTAHFVVAGSVGSIICNADGSKGVSFWLSPDGTEGLMVALEDSSDSCLWGPTEKVYNLISCPFNDVMALKDKSGARNTRGIRNYQGTENEYAATLVDFANGWYLPSASELRKLYAALPMIETPLALAGGSTLTEDVYWSSTEFSATDALTPSFSMSNTNKGSICRVRAIRSFATAGPNCVTVKSNNENFGTAYVSGSGEFAVGQSVTVIAYPEAGYVFDSWTEAGMTVSYSPTYQFNFTRSRALTANFIRECSVGSTIVNADGSKGVVFYTFPSGVGGLMVALEDTSEGCPWGLDEDVMILDNQSPSDVIDLLNDMNGRNNTVRIRAWYEGNANYAACKTDFANGWYLPSAGQLRKLYGALPMIENALINSGGTTLRDDAYWSSTEQSADNAWTPSFAMGSSNKTGNCRVRAIRSVLGTEIIAANVNIVDAGTVVGDGEYDVGQTCSMTAIPAEGYTFINWTDNRSVVSTFPTIQFVVDASRTLTANFLPTDSILIQTINLSQGVNWISTYLDITLENLQDALVAVLPGTTIKISSRTQTTTYNGTRWRGQLATMDVTQMYKIEVTADCEITLEGMPINPAEHPVTIEPGINWIAFPLTTSMTVSEAFEGFAVSGDKLNSRTLSTSYIGTRWRGQLDTLEPGQGYIYNSAATESRTFTFPTSGK